MNENAATSKAKRRRQRRKNKKHHESSQNTPQVCDNQDKLVCNTEYLVDSPKELNRKAISHKKPVKSKSLDDDDMIKIQEVSEHSETDDKEKDNQAIISEASESEVEWEEATCLNTLPPMRGALSTLTLPVDNSYITEQVELISPEEEKTLRNFLQSLNLVTGPDEAAKQVYEKSSIEDIKRRKAKKRAELEQYFLPIAQNPRYLDVISEETSDRDSDRENKSLTKNLKQGTPELDIPPKIPPRPNRDKRRALPMSFGSPIPQAPAILVDTKLLDNTNISEGICTTSKTQEANSAVEIIFLDESTGSNSPEDTSSTSDSYVLLSSNEEISTCSTDNVDCKTDFGISSEIVEKSQMSINSHPESLKDNGLIISQLTPPPTPDSISPKNEICISFLEQEPRICSQDNSCEANGNENEANNISSLPPHNNSVPTSNKIEEKLANSSDEPSNNTTTPPPPPSRSTSSSNSSSRSSLSTAKYIPTISSLTDMSSLNDLHQPLTLREMCLKFLIGLPFGKDILQELADISKTLESLPYSRLVQLASSPSRPEINNISSEVSVTKSAKHLKKEEVKETETSKSSLCDLSNLKVPPEVPVRKYMKINSKERAIPLTKSWMENCNSGNVIDHSGRQTVNTVNVECTGSATCGNPSQPVEKMNERIIPVEKQWLTRSETKETKCTESNIESTERKEIIVPISREWLESSAKKLEILKDFGIFKRNGGISQGLAKSLNEVDINTEYRNLERSDTIPTERVIPISKNWTTCQQKSNLNAAKTETTDANRVEEELENTNNKEICNESYLKKITVPIKREWEPTSSSEEFKKSQANLSELKKNKEVIIPVEKEWSSKEQSVKISVSKNFVETSSHEGHDVSEAKRSNKRKQEVIIPICIEQDLKKYDGGDSLFGEVKGNRATIGKEESKENNIIQSNLCEENRFYKENKVGSLLDREEEGGSVRTPVYQQWRDSKVIQKPDNLSTTKAEVFIPISKEPVYEESKISVDISEGAKSSSMPTQPKEIQIPITKDWVKMPTDGDSNVLLCLSPKQKEELEKTKKLPNETDRLLELHEKFINRVSHEEVKNLEEEKVTITNITVPTTNRLLGIIKEEPSYSSSTEDQNFLYFVDKHTKTSATLPRDITVARLRAKDLSEWLNLARNKSMSESNLSTDPGIPENNLRDMFKAQPTRQRRTSLPYELFEKQMIYLQEKEREIQKQLEELEDEKRRINADMAQAKEFNAEDYSFSRNGDFAESKTRPNSMPLIPTEFFRQKMYQEYMDKFQAREERKHHKVIKVSACKNPESESHEKEIIHPIQLENEFMEKVKQKQKEGKLEKVKSMDKESSSEKEINEGDPVLVMEGEHLKEAKKLPKHLQEFVDITKQSTQTDGESKFCIGATSVWLFLMRLFCFLIVIFSNHMFQFHRFVLLDAWQSAILILNLYN